MATAAARRAKAFKVAKDPPVLEAWDDGSVRVGGTRLLLEVVITGHKLGETPEEIAREYGPTPVGVIHAVLAYYHQHREQVDEYLARVEAESARNLEESERRWPTAGLRERLLATKAETRAQRPG